MGTKGRKGVLEKRPDGKQTLYLPEDLQLWEMVGVMEVVDHDTFAVKPERQNEKKDELVALGKLFQNSGAYIAVDTSRTCVRTLKPARIPPAEPPEREARIFSPPIIVKELLLK